MDLIKAGLRYGTKQAIRSLGYGASCKVGMKFKKAWWMLPPHKINKGGIARKSFLHGMEINLKREPSIVRERELNGLCIAITSTASRYSEIISSVSVGSSYIKELSTFKTL